MTSERQQRQIHQLIHRQRWAALATVRDGVPLAGMVAYAVQTEPPGLLLHLSRLAAHTRHLLRDPRVSLVISEPDDGRPDPQTLARIIIHGSVEVLEPTAPGFDTARDCYLARLPEAAPRFGFADFLLLRLKPERARYVGGFAEARGLDAEEMQAMLGRSSGTR
jgi:heme iron utilization protein